MTLDLDTQALSLLEEHVRRLLGAMGFSDITVRCAVKTAALPAAPAEEDQLLQNAALETPRHHVVAPGASEDELTIRIEAGTAGKLLIGAQGSHLEALQYIIRTILRRKLAPLPHITVDVNSYRQEREENLRHLAEGAARKARATGTPIELKPMSAGDRRVLHSALAGQQGIRTESRGEEPHRRVVIRPTFS